MAFLDQAQGGQEESSTSGQKTRQVRQREAVVVDDLGPAPCNRVNKPFTTHVVATLARFLLGHHFLTREEGSNFTKFWRGDDERRGSRENF